MSVEEAAGEIDRIDRSLRGGGQVADDEKTINLTPLYRRYGWGGGAPSPIPNDAQQKLKISERASDARWSKHFSSNRTHISIYRSQIGYYWLLRYDSALGEHLLEHVGTAADVEQRFGG
jgi:hypothetical protein